MLGPGGPPSRRTPGYVYEVDLQQLPMSQRPRIINPLRELCKNSLAHQHNGDQKFIEGIARKDPSVLTQNVPMVGGSMALPASSSELVALIYALRDAEVLLTSVPSNCVVARHDVW